MERSPGYRMTKLGRGRSVKTHYYTPAVADMGEPNVQYIMSPVETDSGSRYGYHDSSGLFTKIHQIVLGVRPGS